jgi:hypothetical protein
MDEDLGASGKAVFMLHTVEDTEAFLAEPALCKVILLYSPQCVWCQRIAPYYTKLAPAVANSDLLFGAVTQTHMPSVLARLPKETVSGAKVEIRGFPYIMILDSKMQIRKLLPGYMSSKPLLSEIETALPELTTRPALSYLAPLRAGAPPPHPPILPSKRQRVLIQQPLGAGAKSITKSSAGAAAAAAATAALIRPTRRPAPSKQGQEDSSCAIS